MSDELEVIRWYTKARKFPKFVGKLGLSGNPLPGGPYPVASVVGAVVTFLLGSMTMGIWGQGGVITNTGMLLAASAAIGFAAGKLAVGGRNPFLVITGAYRAVSAPRVGDLAGRAVRSPRPRKVQTRANVLVSASAAAQRPTPAPAPAPAAPRVAVMAPSAPRTRPSAVKPALTGVQALLAASNATSGPHSDERNI